MRARRGRSSSFWRTGPLANEEKFVVKGLFQRAIAVASKVVRERCSPGGQAMIDASRVSVNGQAKRPGKKPETTGKQAAKRQRARHQVERWAGLYVKAAVVLSAGLNGYTATVESHASSPVALAAAAVISGIVPGLVWGLGQLAGWL